VILRALAVILFAVPILARAQCATRVCPELSDSAARVAGLIGAQALLEQMRAQPPGSPEANAARSALLEAVLSAMLDVDASVAEIQNEEAQVSEVESYLAARRERFVDVANFASALVGAGVGVAGTALQFSPNTENLGNAIGVASGSISTALVFVARRQERRGRSQLSINSTMLAPFFDPTLGPDYYPDLVWRYLTMPLADTQPPVSWRDQLLRDWQQTGRFELSGNKKAAEKIGFLKSAVPSQRRISLGYLADRHAMLSAVRARISLIKRDLAELMCAARSIPVGK
jgi:hypothetical protein